MNTATQTHPSASASTKPIDVEAIFREKFGLMTSVAYRHTHNWHDAEDAAQNAFVHALEVADQFDPDTTDDGGRAWVITMAKMQALSLAQWRKKRRENYAPDWARDETGISEWLGRLERADNSDDGVPCLAEDGVADQIRVALEWLPVECGEALELRCLRGMSGPAASRLTGIPRPTIESRLRRGLAMLRAGNPIREVSK